MMMGLRRQKNNKMRFNLYLRIDINSIYGRNKLGCIMLFWLRDAQIFQKLYVQTQKSKRRKCYMKQTPYTANPGILGTTQQNFVVQEL
jgi:hypothetical protein